MNHSDRWIRGCHNLDWNSKSRRSLSSTSGEGLDIIQYMLISLPFTS